MVRATSPQGGQRVSRPLPPFALPRAAPAAKKGRSHHQHPSRAARRCAGRGGTREAQPRLASPQRSRGIRVVPRLMRRFVNAQNHSGWGSGL